MIQVCPTCGGGRVNCPTCNAPPRRVLPKSDIYKGKLEHRKMMILYGAPVYEVTGIDISRWNGTMNFSVTKTKCQYVIMRAGYGAQWQDGSLEVFYQGAKAQDMPVGFYWYCRDYEDPYTTADSFASIVQAHQVQLDVVLDIETSTLNNPTAELNWILACDGRFRNKTGRVPMIYTSKGFWDTGVARSGNWASRRLWDANWTIRDYPAVPLDWNFKQGDHWQWSADGNRKAAEYGSTGGDADMDLDRYYGTVEQFNIAYGTHIKHMGEPPPPPPPPGQCPENILINIGELAIHDTPFPYQNNIVGHALINTTWHPYEEVTANGVTWYRVTKDGYISKAYTRLP